MPSFPDTAVLVLLALILFGPKKLPVLARQLGKLMADFRRASNEFRTQMEEELRISEQADRQKQIAAIEATAPATALPETYQPPPEPALATLEEPTQAYAEESMADLPAEIVAAPEATASPAPIATSGELSILPPATGLPVSNSAPAASAEAIAQTHDPELETETLHG